MRPTPEGREEGVATGLAGEYYVLAQLTQRNFVAALTLSNTKSVDILVWNRARSRSYQIEVKTSLGKPAREKLFGEKPFYHWIMRQAHEKIQDADLYYCFVALQAPTELPRFFIVPSAEVARYVAWQHQKWLKVDPKHKDTPMRKFRIATDDPEHYQGNWKVFE